MSKAPARLDKATLLLIASIIAIGGVIYELILSTATSYLFGDSTKAYSLGIGLSLFGMGIGSILATRFFKEPLRNFMRTELLLSLLGGTSVILLYAAYSLTKLYWLVFVVLTVVIGILIGLEIPLVVETYRSIKKSSKTFLSRVLSVDYMGALVGALLFPFVLLPYLGLIRSALAVGLLNIIVVAIILIRAKLKARSLLTTSLFIGTGILLSCFIFATRIEAIITDKRFVNEVIYYQNTPYQNLVMTKNQDDIRLYLNNNLQFSSRDEARYHETLVHTAMLHAPEISSVLIIGGGDGMAVREALKYPETTAITLVDLDPAMTNLAKSNRVLQDLNKNALNDSRVRIVNQDAQQFLRTTKDAYDVIIIDLVDPGNEKLARLYSIDFYREAKAILSKNGVLITQATSSFFTPESFWTIHNNIGQSFSPTALSTNVPSFGEWGFVTTAKLDATARPLPENLRYITDQVLVSNRQIGLELLAKKHDRTSTMLQPTLHRTYSNELSHWAN